MFHVFQYLEDYSANVMKIIVNQKFKDALITGILSSPIIYIPHFHYAYVDQALKEIIPSKDDANSVLGLRRSQIVELSNEDGKVNFERKYKSETSKYKFVELLRRMVSSDRKDKDNGKVNFLGFDQPAPKTDEFKVEEGEIFHDEKIFVVKNVAEQLFDPKVQYWLQVFASKYENGDFDCETTLILVSPKPVAELPSEIEKYVSIVEVPAPMQAEIEQLVKGELPISKQFERQGKQLTDSLVRTMMGLQLYEIEQIIRSIQVRTGGHLTEKALTYALEEKKSIVKKSGIIEVVDSDVSFNQVGGLQALREDLEQKAIVFKHLDDIQKMKFPLPKGVLILGMPGCGKSLIAKSIASLFKVSLLRLDVNRLMGQYVGQSEENLRKALATAEAAHPCVLWIDEIEKAFAGVNSGNSGNDIIMRLMGHFLTWMQERKTAVYIVATANDALRPELMRKGRFDEVYFVDFPNQKEREDIFKKKINKFRETTEQQKMFDFDDIDSNLVEIAKLMNGGKKKDSKKADSEYESDTKASGFSGAEIEAVVNAVMEKKYVEYYKKQDEEDEKQAKDESDGKKENDEKKTVETPKLKVTKKDFEEVINAMRPSVMCNQTGAKDENGKTEKTPIERIRQIQEVYKFKLATKEN